MREILLHRIETFTEVVEQQSFSAAAKRLGLTQPAVSIQIRELEKQLGVQLLTRAGRRSVPTSAGAEFLKHAQNITGAVVAALDGMSHYSERTTARLRLGMDPSAGFLMPPLFWRELRSRQPELDIQVHSWDTSTIIQGLYNKQLDLGIINLPPTGTTLDVRSVMQDELLLIGAEGDTRLPEKLTATALAELPLLSYQPGGEMVGIVQGWFSRKGERFTPLMEIGDIDAIKQLVTSGLGYALLPSRAISREERASFTLRRLAPRLYRKLALVVRDDEELHPSLQSAIDLFDSLSLALAPGSQDFPMEAVAG
jgi:DNA-binding transcriptional LysR family regulator